MLKSMLKRRIKIVKLDRININKNSKKRYVIKI